MRNALNEVLRTEYIKDCQRGVDRWNKTIKDEGIDFELALPSNKFHRQIGMWAGHQFTPERRDARRGDVGRAPRRVAADRRRRGVRQEPDAARCYERGKMASWIAPPIKGINGLPGDFEYVRL